MGDYPNTVWRLKTIARFSCFPTRSLFPLLSPHVLPCPGPSDTIRMAFLTAKQLFECTCFDQDGISLNFHALSIHLFGVRARPAWSFLLRFHAPADDLPQTLPSPFATRFAFAHDPEVVRQWSAADLVPPVPFTSKPKPSSSSRPLFPRCHLPASSKEWMPPHFPA